MHGVPTIHTTMSCWTRTPPGEKQYDQQQVGENKSWVKNNWLLHLLRVVGQDLQEMSVNHDLCDGHPILRRFPLQRFRASELLPTLRAKVDVFK